MSLLFCTSQPLLLRNFSISCRPSNRCPRTSTATPNRCPTLPGDLLRRSLQRSASNSDAAIPVPTVMAIKRPDGKTLQGLKILAGAAIAALFLNVSLDVPSVLSHERNPVTEENLKPKLALVPVPQRLSQGHESENSDHASPFRARWEVHSVDSRTETLFVLSNQTPSVVDLWWIDYCGREVYYATINPGGTHMQPSFATHPWVVRDHLSQNTVLMLVATPKPFLAIVNSV